MKKSVAHLVFLVIAAISLFTLPAFSRTIIQESVADAVSQSPASSYLDLLISFDNELDLTAVKINRLRTRPGRIENYHYVMDRLMKNRQALEDDLKPQLEAMKAAGKIDSYRFFTVSRTILVRTRADNVEHLSQLTGARLINLNHNVSLIEPVDDYSTPAFSKATLANTALDAINIRDLWDRGLTGAGRLICSFDTGIDGDHPALSSKWRGNNGATATASWYAPHGGSTPVDNIGHGSHVMGVMVGSDGFDTIGVAPGAQWISAAVIDQGVSFSTTIADILNAFDWALNPDGNINTTDDLPDVICNSWGVPRGIYSDCDNTFWTAIDNVEAAGIVTIFAAGNEGPSGGTMRNPADRASSPLNTLSVGAVDPQSLIIADFSSRGPASCDGVSIKPELVAPGVSIYSSFADGGYRLMSGTSMAAPFVAGLVALMRQYNPEATVSAIKSALIQAAVDLGPAGEDNAYGHGVIDAARVLEYLPAPEMPNISVYNHSLSSGGDEYADPGETAEMTLTLNEPTAMVDSVDVWITSNSEWVTAGPDSIRYYFAQGTAYAVSLDPFYLGVSPEAISGGNADLMVHFGFMNGLGQDSIGYTITLGHPAPGQLFSVQAGQICLTASDFGQFGFGQGSIYQAGGEGLRFGESANVLFEAGLIVGRSEQMVSDGIRSGMGQFKVSDFVPQGSVPPLTTDFDEVFNSAYTDNASGLPIPVKVEQAIYHSGQDFIILQFDVVNPTPQRVDRLAVGFFIDMDIDRHNDQIGFDSLMGLFYQYHEAAGLYFGLIGVSANEFAYTAARNEGTYKSGFTKAEKYQLVNGSGINIDGIEAGDWYCTVSRRSGLIEGFGRCKTAIVLAAGQSLSDLRAAAETGMNEYGMYLDIDDNRSFVPDKIELEQNYPNPFNPETTIGFALHSAQDVSLTVYNVAGQKVRTLFEGLAQPGRHTVVWDGRDDDGRNVATGIYFYRLIAENETQNRKMLFLK